MGNATDQTMIRFDEAPFSAFRVKGAEELLDAGAYYFTHSFGYRALVINCPQCAKIAITPPAAPRCYERFNLLNYLTSFGREKGKLTMPKPVICPLCYHAFKVEAGRVYISPRPLT